MIAIASSQEAPREPFRPDDPDSDIAGHVSTFFGHNEELREGPQAVRVDITNGTVPPHFHIVDQFQIIVGGHGTVGKHPVDPGTIHYTDGYTPYGPISTGVSYFVLRAQADVAGHL